MFSRPWLTVLRRHVLIHRRALAFVLTVAAVLLGWAAFVARPPAIVAAPVTAAASTPSIAPGWVRLPVRFADGEMAGLLRPGDQIQLWAAQPGARGARLVASRAQVIEVPEKGEAGVMTATRSRLVVVSVLVTEVESVASFNANGALTYVVAH